MGKMYLICKHILKNKKKKDKVYQVLESNQVKLK